MSAKTGKILVIDDNEDILLAAKLFLKQHFALVDTEVEPKRIPALLKNENYDVILLDMNYHQEVTTGAEGMKWLGKILELDPAAVVIMITAYGDVELAVKAIKAGANDFVLKPWQNEKLLATISSAMRLRQSHLEIDRLRSRQKQLSADLDQRFQEIIGMCGAMQEVFATIDKVARTDANVLIMGENGTGKELAARALHRNSQRANEVFICADMGAMAETLFESELFGHEKGAFTDAKEKRLGRFEVASGGTLFLDEIGNIPLHLQAKLLRALETRQINRLGSNHPIEIDIRLICATNVDIHEMTAQRLFRQDLLYRINTVEIKLPPLRERREDISLLAHHFLSAYSAKYKKQIREISPTALKKLQNYAWPGNIREMSHSIERAVILSESDSLEAQDFFFRPAEAENIEVMLDSLNLEDLEKSIIRKALKKHNGNISHTAEELGLTRAALYRRMEKFGI